MLPIVTDLVQDLALILVGVMFFIQLRWAKSTTRRLDRVEEHIYEYHGELP